jgi:CubicO group peptidase (beta-lactamase class C family)
MVARSPARAQAATVASNSHLGVGSLLTVRGMSHLALPLAALATSVLAAVVPAPTSDAVSTNPAPTTIRGVSALAESDAARDVSKILADVRAKHDVPALVGAVTTSERTVAIGAAGFRQRGNDAPVRVDDRMHLGSCTKSMTATLCAIVVEEKKLAWDTKVVDVLGKGVSKVDPGWNEATLAQLLSNSAGAPADLDADGLWTKLWISKASSRDQRALLVSGVLGRPPVAPPGTKFVYSNAGFSLAGAMVERVLDTSFEEAMTKRLFEPLGMKSAGFGAPGTKGKVDEPLGHRPNGKPVELGEGDDNPPAIAPAGRAHMSVEDWAKYVRVHLAGARTKSGAKDDLVSPATITKLHTKVLDDYAMGWSVTKRDWGGEVLMHNGSNTMWFCVVWIAPEKDFAVLVASNQGGDAGSKATDAAAWALIQEHTKRSKDK